MNENKKEEMDREHAVKTVAKLWNHYLSDLRAGSHIEAQTFRRKAERLMDQYIPAITLEEAMPKQKRISLEFLTDDVYRVRYIVGVLKLAEGRQFLKLHAVTMERPDGDYCLNADFSGKVKNVDFMLNHLNNLPEDL